MGHSRLLIRSAHDLGDDTAENEDLHFAGVVFLAIPDRFDGLSICEGSGDDTRQILSRCRFELFPDTKVYALESSGERYFVAASSFRVDRNKLDPMTSVLD